MSFFFRIEHVMYMFINVLLLLGCRSRHNNDVQYKLNKELEYEYIKRSLLIDTNQYSKIIYDTLLIIYDSLYILNRRINKEYWYYSKDTNSICFLDNDTIKCLFPFALYQYAIKIFPPKYIINRIPTNCNTTIENNENLSKQVEINSLLYLNKKTISIGDTIKMALLSVVNSKNENPHKQIKKDYCCQYLVVKDIDISLDSNFNRIYNEVTY